MEKITKSSDKVLIDPNEPLILPDGTALVGRVEWFLYALCCLDYQNLPTPMSRIEEFANALITGEVPNIEPQSRAEQFFLAILDGNVSNLPQPQSRSEVLLDKLARGEFDLSDVEPIQSSYELLLAYLIKNGGIGNIDYVLYEFSEAMKTMYNTVEKPFKSLELSGNTLVNCVLEDTENDDYTSFDEDYSGTSFTINGTSEGAIKSAILKGQTLVNLFDGHALFSMSNTVTSYDEGVYTFQAKEAYEGAIAPSNIMTLKTAYKLELNKKYTLFVTQLSGNPCQFGVQSMEVGNKNSTNQNISEPQTHDSRIHKITFTLTSDYSELRLRLNTYQTTQRSIQFKEIMLIEGDYTNVNIPYFEGIQSVKMPVLKATGKNLFDGKFTKYNNIYGLYYFDNGVYTYSITDNDVSVDLSGVAFGDAENGSTSINWLIDSGSVYGDKRTITNRNLVFYPNNEETFNKIKQRYNIQIEQGSVATSYEPYKTNILSTPEDLELRGIGNVKDELNVATGEMVQNIYEFTLDGSQNIDKDGDLFYYYLPFEVHNNKSICDKLPSITVGQLLDGLTGIAPQNRGNSSRVYVKVNGITTKEEMKNFFLNNPTTIQLMLETPTIKTVDLNVVDQNNIKIDKIHVFNETTHVNASSDELTPTVNIGKSVSYPTIIKPSTKYTVDLKRNDKPLTVNLGGTEVTFTSGETRKVITTPSTLTNDKLSYYGVGAKCNEIMLIEGEVEGNVDYFTGMQSVVMQNQMPILHTMGKNLFNGVYSDNYLQGGEETVFRPSNGDKKTRGFLVKCKPNTTYTVTRSFISNRFTIGGFPTPPKDNDYYVTYKVTENTFTTDGTNIYVYVYVSNEAQEPKVLFEESQVATLYEDYKTSILSLPKEVVIRSLPNGVHDTFDTVNGVYTKRIGEVVLDGKNYKNFSKDFELENDTTCKYFISNFFSQYLDGKGGQNEKVVLNCNYLPSVSFNHIQDKTLSTYPCIANSGAGSLNLRVGKDINSTSLLLAYLQSNPITIQYELVNPIVETVDLNIIDQDGNTIPKIKSYNDVTHLEVTVPKQSLLPNVSAEVATDNSKDMSSLTIKHQEISETQSAIEDNIQSQSDEIDTALMATTEIFESILE